MKKVLHWCKTNIIFSIVVIIAAISCIIVPIDMAYLDYIEWDTISSIFSILLIVACLENIDFFQKIARAIIKKFKTTRSIIIVLIMITYFSALINANDMALLTFLPLSYLVLSYTNNLDYLAFTFVMQNIASNLGGMITPIGNPQNIYLFSFYDIGLIEFFKIMALPTLFSFVLIASTFLFIKKTPIVYDDNYDTKINMKKLLVYLGLFVLTFLTVCKIVPFLISLPIVVVTALVVDRKSFTKVDYTIPLTFCAFFIFSGNMARVPLVIDLMTSFVDQHTFLTAYLSCQLISNVPTAILLSKFTGNYAQLLVSVNVASLGIIFSSLSGLIALKMYVKHRPEHIKNATWKYVGIDFLFNIGMLIILYPATYFVTTLLF